MLWFFSQRGDTEFSPPFSKKRGALAVSTGECLQGRVDLSVDELSSGL